MVETLDAEVRRVFAFETNANRNQIRLDKKPKFEYRRRLKPLSEMGRYADRERNEVAYLMSLLAMASPHAPCEASVMPGQRIIAVNDNGTYENLRIREPRAAGAIAGRGKVEVFVSYADMVVPRGKDMTVEKSFIGSAAENTLRKYGLVA